MTIAIMQPYLFPYIGYFQLIKSVDKFVFYDDVNYIKQGWINRNRILIAGKAHIFTVPIMDMSSFNLIHETLINQKLYHRWKEKLFKTITLNYKKAPYFDTVFPLVKEILDTSPITIGELAIKSIRTVGLHLGLNTSFLQSSVNYPFSKNVGRLERLAVICKEEAATNYINAIGGMKIYEKKEFSNFGIKLFFLQPRNSSYKQFDDDYVDGLSIIDVMMFNSVEVVNRMLDQFQLI